MNYLHSGNKTFTSLQQGKQRDLQLGDDPGDFLFVNATNSDKLGTFGNLNVKSDFEFDDFALEGVGLPLQSMKSKMKPRSLLPSFDKAKTSAEVMMASQALEVLVSDEDWIETLYRESEDIFPETLYRDIFSDAIDLLPISQDWGLPCSMNDASIPATITPPRRFGYTKDISKQKERLDGQKALETERPKPVPLPSSQDIISSNKVTDSTSRETKKDLHEQAELMLSFKRSRKATKLFQPERISRPAKKPRTRMSYKKPDLVKSKPTKKSNKSVKPDVVKSKATFKKTKLNPELQVIEIEQLPNTSCKRIHDSQALQWSTKYRDFLEFKKEHGHTAVPHWYEPNMQLSRWVKRQRYQYKLRKAGKPSTLTDARIEALKSAGFIWDSHSNVWVARYNDLRAFEKENGHCNVAFDKRAGSGQHNALASWVKHQRRQCKLLQLGEPSHMTPERMNNLDRLGFQWRLKNGRRTPTASSVDGAQI